MASYKIWILGIVLIFAFISIAPWSAFKSGVMIQSVEKNSTEFEKGLRSGMIITEINSNEISNLEDFSAYVSKLTFNETEPTKMSITTDSGDFVFIKETPLSITVEGIPKTKLKTGLDLSGGARALIRPENVSLDDSQISDLVAITTERFNVYGLKDISIRPVKDLEGTNYLLIEIAGATPSDMEDLVSNQGKFEGKIGNITVFSGGKNDIPHVDRSGQTTGIEGCYDNSDGSQYCTFVFGITLSEEAAQKQADVTSNLSLSTENPEYLSEKLDLYLDDTLMDSLSISKDLKGRVTTQISIQGSGSGNDRAAAIDDAEVNMKKLQTILITGSLPYKLEIVKLDTISPVLGKEFINNLLKLGLIVFGIMSLILFIRYRKIKLTLAVILTMFSEVFITLGIAALIKWNLDAPAIAGIIAGMGTGVNDQIVIIDESESTKDSTLKQKIQNAFFIIIGAFFTIFAAMLPLFWAGAGLLRGFALTTLICVTVGILITRPAFAEILRKIKE
jgi:preprotein translocase subunit SecD